MAKVYGDETTARDEFRKLKNEPLKVKLQWVWQYYGILIGIILLFLVLGISALTAIVHNSVPVVLSGMSYSSEFEDDVPENLKSYVLEHGDFNKKKYKVDYTYGIYNTFDIQTYYVTIQKTVARISAHDLDFLVGYADQFKPYVSDDEEELCAFEDLHNLMSAELYEKLESEGRIQCLSGPWGERTCLLLLDNSPLYDLLGLSGEGHYIGFTENAPHPEAVDILLKAME